MYPLASFSPPTRRQATSSLNTTVLRSLPTESAAGSVRPRLGYACCSMGTIVMFVQSTSVSHDSKLQASNADIGASGFQDSK